MISLSKMHYTNLGIKENGTFSVNVPSAAMADITDYCGMVSGKKYDKAKLFETFYGKLKTAPMIKECPFNVECKVIQTVEIPGHELFIGEIIAAYSDERYLTKGLPDLQKIAPFIYFPTRSANISNWAQRWVRHGRWAKSSSQSEPE